VILNFRHYQNYSLPEFNDHQVILALSSRVHKNMSLCYGDTTSSLNNRKRFLKNLGIDYRTLVCAKQIHSSQIKYVTAKDLGRGALSYKNAIKSTDALITDKKNVPLSIFTADCLSVFLYAPKTPSIGLVHAGWRSSKENITVKAVQLMQEKFNAKAEDLYAGFGPAIRDCCFEVEGEFTDFFEPEYLIKRDGRYYLDLAGINKKQLLAQGVKDKNIFDSKICTSCRNEEFFSYRKEGIGCGRMISVIMLK